MEFNQTQAQLEISFDGPAIKDGLMNVRDLAPSMLGIGELFDSANRILNGTQASVSVNVRATSQSSFHIVYQVVQSYASGMSFGELVTTAASMKTLIFGGGGGLITLFGLIKVLRGRKPKVEKVNDNLFKLTIDNQTYDVPLELLRLYQDTTVHRAISDMVRPVREVGIEVLEVREHETILHSVTKQDIQAFDIPEGQEPLLDQTRRYAFSILSLAFKEDNKWRLTDGHATYSVSMKDTVFLNKVDNNDIAFAKGDILVCDLHIIQWQGVSGIKTEYEVVKVHKHIQARQIPMFNLLDEPEETDHGGS